MNDRLGSDTYDANGNTVGASVAGGGDPGASFTYAYDFENRIVSAISASSAVQIVYDGHGNVRFLTDEGGQITDTYDYDAFGNIITRSGTTPNNYLYCGEQFDPDLGLYFLRARYMNTERGRFWTMDVLEGSPWDPSSLHRYLYVRDDPANAVDPTGMVTFHELMVRLGIDQKVRSMEEWHTLHRWRMLQARHCATVAASIPASIREYSRLKVDLSGTPFEAHHVFRNAKMIVFAGYTREIGLCSPVLGSATRRLSPHWLATQAQLGVSYGSLGIDAVAWLALVAAGCRPSDATAIVQFVRETYTLMGIFVAAGVL